MKKLLFIALLFCFYGKTSAIQKISTESKDTVNLKDKTHFIKVHFLYGSKPKKKFKATESKWFGGILGGHVGIEKDSNVVFNFVPSGSFHVFAKKKERHSSFTTHSPNSFWTIMGSHHDSVKKLTVLVPISARQGLLFDSLSKAYREQTPYDYAFFGMRCGAAAYDVLARIGVMKKFRYRKTHRKIFYPKRLRKRLIKKAKRNGWKMIRNEGSERRKWERD
ncbi:MAG: hypothetical protein IAF38_14190 [Bacteroidia bacterium]|nr:hypothetical protein [Bacteroidia bacterium]